MSNGIVATHNKTVRESQNMKQEVETKIFELITAFEHTTGIAIEYIDVKKTMDPKTYKYSDITESVSLRARI